MVQQINLETFFDGLDALYQSKNKSTVQPYLEQWLQKAREAEDSGAIVAVANELGGYYRAIGALSEAKALYDEALVRLQAMGLKQSEHYATTLINAGDVYVYEGDYDTALVRFLEAKALLEHLGLGGEYRMAALCNNISMAYRAIGKYDLAETALNRAFYIMKGLPTMQSELATTFINLGSLQIKQHKLTMAEASFSEACKIYEDAGGVDVHYAAACAGLGEVCYLRREYATARKHYRKALALIERDFGRTAYYDMIKRNIDHLSREVV